MEEKGNTTTDILQVYREKGPIGYWVKKADDAFSNVTRKTPEHGNFNRLEWQFLNTVHENEKLTTSEVLKHLGFFTDEAGIGKLIKRFEAQRLIHVYRHDISITEKGRQAYDEVVRVQEEILIKAMQNISTSAYRTTIDTLETLLKNLRPYTL